MTEKLSVSQSPPPTQDRRRRSSLEGVPFVGSYFAKKREEREQLPLAIQYLTVYSDFFHAVELKPYEIAFFVKAFKLPIKVKATEVTKQDFLNLFDSAVESLEEDPEKKGSIFKLYNTVDVLTYLEKRTFRESLCTGLIPGLITAMQTIETKNFFLKQATPLKTDPETGKNNVGGFYFDVCYLYALASQGMKEDSETSVITERYTVATKFEHNQKLRLSKTMRCFNIMGHVTTYGEFYSNLSPEILKRKELDLIPLVEDTDSISEGVLISGAFRKAQDTWRYIN